MLHRHLKQETLVFFFQAFYSSGFLNLNYGTTNACNCLNQKSRGYTWHLPDIQRSVNLQNIFCLSTSFHPQGHHPTPSHHHLSPKALPWTSNGFCFHSSPVSCQQTAILLKCKCDHFSSLCKSLQWPPFAFRVKTNNLSLAYETLHDLTPSCVPKLTQHSLGTRSTALNALAHLYSVLWIACLCSVLPWVLYSCSSAQHTLSSLLQANSCYSLRY